MTETHGATTGFVTVSTAARIAHTSSETIRKWYDTGEVTGRRSRHGHRLIDTESLRRRMGYVGVASAAQRAGCSEQTMRMWFDRGQVEGFRTQTGQRRILLSSIEARPQLVE